MEYTVSDRLKFLFFVLCFLVPFIVRAEPLTLFAHAFIRESNDCVQRMKNSWVNIRCYWCILLDHPISILDLEEYINSECSLNCWVRWMQSISVIFLGLFFLAELLHQFIFLPLLSSWREKEERWTTAKVQPKRTGLFYLPFLIHIHQTPIIGSLLFEHQKCLVKLKRKKKSLKKNKENSDMWRVSKRNSR